jgi:hypothetical protein
MRADRRSRPRRSDRDPDVGLQPRVVILDAGESPQVEILELPPSVTLGASFQYSGQSWQVTGLRTGQRVLIAEPKRRA